MLTARTGPFVDFLQSIDAWTPDAFPANLSISKYLSALTAAEKVLVIHGNFLSPAERSGWANAPSSFTSFIAPAPTTTLPTKPIRWKRCWPAAYRSRWGPTREPRTRTFRAGVSCSCCPKISGLTGQQLLKLATVNAAAALNVSAELGSLTVGKAWSGVAVDAASLAGSDPLRELLQTNLNGPRPLWPVDPQLLSPDGAAGRLNSQP